MRLRASAEEQAILPKQDMDGRVALVTGASAGLGARFARMLAAAGAAVVVGARRIEAVTQLAEKIAADGGRAIGVELDVTSESSVIAAYDLAEQAFGTVTTVVANAGVNAAAPALDLAVEQFDLVLATNVTGVFLTAREGARRLIARGETSPGGRFVVLSSITARQVVRGLAAYAASKAAVEQMGRVLAKDWARHGINVNMLAPGNIGTDLTGAWFEGLAGRRQLAGFPRQRLMLPEDLDAAILFLCSDASAAVTGTVLTIDDGQSL